MNGLKRCPCGKIPQELNIMCDAYYGFAVATCDHCCHWSVLVHATGHTDADTEKTQSNVGMIGRISKEWKMFMNQNEISKETKTMELELSGTEVVGVGTKCGELGEHETYVHFACAWCAKAGEEATHSVANLGGIDIVTGEKLCVECAESGIER